MVKSEYILLYIIVLLFVNVLHEFKNYMKNFTNTTNTNNRFSPSG